ncbi:thiosulfate/3-mercaptopyruvate sulfurtransferase 1, mitochondrial-like [Dorcoceras hygrometricum]|uniref:Thiosulfate/3-mercaptopyruvate sulfurtransferase 1, mitochondrial-like n=1 Tax=Dorcoceras hygrometricum TaxID=472368 RepID=A0A2Z7BUS7_9LAMI|nr:thiosulfate/3-mercaptopyruvate sulfurtransferase 1, mitochondrial-like [Dorcoceras hygrometricum]
MPLLPLKTTENQRDNLAQDNHRLERDLRYEKRFSASHVGSLRERHSAHLPGSRCASHILRAILCRVPDTMYLAIGGSSKQFPLSSTPTDLIQLIHIVQTS